MYRHRQALTFTVAALATSCCDGFNSYPPRGMRVRLHHGLSSTLADSATERANQLQQPVYDPFIASHVQGAGFRPRSFTAEEAEAARAPARVPPLAETPSKRDVMAAVPAHCFQRSTAKSLLYAAGSVADPRLRRCGPNADPRRARRLAAHLRRLRHRRRCPRRATAVDNVRAGDGHGGHGMLGHSP